MEALQSPLLDPSFEIEGVEDKEKKEGEKKAEGGEQSDLELAETVMSHRKGNNKIGVVDVSSGWKNIFGFISQ